MKLDVRRLAAVDMHGLTGSRLRRRIILAEFLLGVVAGCGLGLWAALTTSSVGWRVFGIAVVGIGLNYVPLALHALSLSPAGRLETELEGVDIPAELRHYTGVQFWILVPGLVAVLGVRQALAARRR